MTISTKVVRSSVPTLASYGEYREFLRFDFWYSCAYCSLSEVEALGIGFQIDHFEPQDVCSGDVHGYGNLMWACSVCNRSKSNIWPSSSEIAAGYRFVRPDLDELDEHYKVAGPRLVQLTSAGEYTIEVLFLNRASLRRLRDARRRLHSTARGIVRGLQALRGARIDKLKPDLRRQFSDASQKLSAQAQDLAATVDDAMIRVLNHSPLLDPDPEVRSRPYARRKYLESLSAKVATTPEVVEETTN